MNDLPLQTRAPNPSERVLREKFAEDMAGQSAELSKLAQQLITLELGIPGLYAAALKLTQGEVATLAVDGWLVGAFVCWFVALGLTLWSLIPQRWRVDPTRLKSDPGGAGDSLSLEDYFRESAAFKRRRLVGATVIFFAGIVAAAVAIF
jgi:hypothetical protein